MQLETQKMAWETISHTLKSTYGPHSIALFRISFPPIRHFPKKDGLYSSLFELFPTYLFAIDRYPISFRIAHPTFSIPTYFPPLRRSALLRNEHILAWKRRLSLAIRRNSPMFLENKRYYAHLDAQFSFPGSLGRFQKLAKY